MKLRRNPAELFSLYNTTVESLFLTLLVVTILLLFLLILIPAGLETLSRRNRQQRAAMRDEKHRLVREASRLDLALRPYGRLRSAAYHDAAEAAAASLGEVNERLAETETLIGQLSCPRVDDKTLLPLSHFVINPGDSGLILADARRLRVVRAELAAAAAAAENTRAAISAIEGLPEQLAAEQAALARRLTAVKATVAAEQAAGIENMDDLTREATGVGRLLGEWARHAADGATPASLDEGAQALETATARLDELASRADLIAADRAALDELLRRGAQEMDEAAALVKSGPEAADASPQVRAPLRRAAALLNETAVAHRRRRDFAAAGTAVTEARRLIALASDVTAADRQARRLAERDDGMSLHEGITELQSEISNILDFLGREATAAPGQGEAVWAGRAAQARARAESLTRQQDEVIANLEREAAATLQRLEGDWAAAQRLLRLADDDPLSRRHAQLREAYTAAQRRPADLEQFRRDVTAFEGVVGPWVSRVQGTRARIGRLRERLPDLIQEAIDTAALWRSLAADVAFIQQRAIDFETLQANFAAARHRREADTLMDAIEAVERDVDERANDLQLRARRLLEMEREIDELISLLHGEDGQLPADHPERPKWEVALKRIAHHRERARSASHYEDAARALQLAVEQANRM